MAIRKIYDWTMSHAATKQAEGVLAAVAFAESSFFPIPPDIMLVPMILARPNKAFYLAGLATLFSVLGGLLGYAIGYFLAATAGQWIIHTYHLEAGFERFQQGFADWGVWIIILKGLTPIPYKLVTIASGIAKFPLLSFIGASIVARAMRFFLVAVLLRFYGDRARQFIEKYLPWVMAGIALLIVVGFLLVMGL